MKTLIVLTLSVFIVACGEVPRCDSETAKNEIDALLFADIRKAKQSGSDKMSVSFSDLRQSHLTDKGDRYCKGNLHVFVDGDTASFPIDYSFYKDSDGDTNIRVNLGKDADLAETILWGLILEAAREAKGRK